VLSINIPLWVLHKQSTKQAIYFSLPASKPVISMHRQYLLIPTCSLKREVLRAANYP